MLPETSVVVGGKNHLRPGEVCRKILPSPRLSLAGEFSYYEKQEPNMDEHTPLSWQEIYHRVLRESDPEKLKVLALALETAIVSRRQQLEGSSNSHEEKEALKRATDALYALKVERLNYPDWKAQI